MAREHWPFNFPFAPQFSPFPNADERLMILASFMKRNGKSTDEIEYCLWSFSRQLMLVAGPVAIAVFSQDLCERLIKRFAGIGQEQVVSSLNILSKTARTLGT